MAYTTIDNPSEHFNTVTYTGNGGTDRSITGVGFQPDWVWIKERNTAVSHMIYNSTIGANKRLSSNTDGAEATDSDGLKSFDSDGWTMDAKGSINGNSDTYVAWNWKANGGTTTTNDASATSIGSIDSTIQANTTAGFSIVTYTGTGSIGSLAHGLGAVPHVMIVKNRSKSVGESWTVYHYKNTSAPETENLQLNTTNATSDTDAPWNDTAPTSTVFTVKNDDVTNDSGETFVGYFFTEIQGYSKFGSYTGNGNANGPFVYTGFKPAWVMIRRTDSGNSWTIRDSKRSTFNVMQKSLFPDLNNAEADSSNYNFDFLSNGFKQRNANGIDNASGGTYIYMAFAEHPFVSSKGVPVTAR